MFQEPRERDPNLTQLFTGVVVCIVLMLSSFMLGVNVPQHSIWNFIASVGVILGMTIGIGAVALQVVYQGLEVREQSKIMKREEQARSRYK